MALMKLSPTEYVLYLINFMDLRTPDSISFLVIFNRYADT